jgi:hypothetical protein
LQVLIEMLVDAMWHASISIFTNESICQLEQGTKKNESGLKKKSGFA